MTKQSIEGIPMYDPNDKTISADIHRRLKPLWDKMPELEAEVRAVARGGRMRVGAARGYKGPLTGDAALFRTKDEAEDALIEALYRTGQWADLCADYIEFNSEHDQVIDCALNNNDYRKVPLKLEGVDSELVALRAAIKDIEDTA
jgi:hypothetical protein